MFTQNSQRPWIGRLLCGIIIGLVVGGAIGLVNIDGGQECEADETPEMLLRGAPFRVAWNKPTRAQFDQITLRAVLDLLLTDRKLAWVTDRRLDLDQIVTCGPTDAPLSNIMDQLVAPLDASVVVVGSTIIIGPTDSVRWLRTLSDLQGHAAKQTGMAAAVTNSLRTPIDLQWDELAQPRELAEQLIERRRLTVSGVEQIPYDLWNRGALTGVTTGEALAIIAWQYDLQVNWTAGGQAELQPLVLPVSTTRTVRLSAPQRARAPQEFPEIHWKPDLVQADANQPVIASGRLEDLEKLQEWLKGAKPTSQLHQRKIATEWSKKKFASFRVESAPVDQILGQLQEQGLPIQWNSEELSSAGIDMKSTISIDLKQPTLQEIMQAICQPVGLKYEITTEAIKLIPQ